MEVFLDAGDAVHRVKAGHLIYRYDWGNNRYGYRPSDALLVRLTPEHRRIIQSLPPIHPPVNHEKF